MTDTRKPHVHAEVIKAWADGAEIEYYSEELDCWLKIIDNCITWNKFVKYRVKSKPKTVVKYHGIMQGTDGYEEMSHNTGYYIEARHVCSNDNKWKVIAIVKTTFVNNVPVSVEII